MNPELDTGRYEAQRAARVNGWPVVIPHIQKSNSPWGRVQKVEGRKHRDTAPRARPPEEAREWEIGASWWVPAGGSGGATAGREAPGGGGGR